MDKDCAEIESSKAVFLDARVLLCAFHTLKTFRKETASHISDPKLKETVREIVAEMVNCSSKDRFDELTVEMQTTAPEAFWQYYQTNWGGCPEMWAAHTMNDVGHLGNRTTNRIESFHQKLKIVLKKEMTVADCITALLKIHHSMLDTASHKKKLSTVCTYYNTEGQG